MRTLEKEVHGHGNGPVQNEIRKNDRVQPAAVRRVGLGELQTKGVDSVSGMRFLCDINDPLETSFRGEHAESLSGPRYNHRTEVFESLLKFVKSSLT